MRVEVSEQGVRPAASRLSEVGKRSVDAKPVFSVIVDDLVAREQELWSALPWPADSPETLARKLRMGVDQRVMHETGALARSLTTKRGPGQKLRIAKTSMTFGTKLFYARFAQVPAKHEPRRQVTYITESDIHAFAERIKAYLLGGEAL